MHTRYPIVLVKGVLMRDGARKRAFGEIEWLLREAGFCVFTAPIDAVGSIETNAVQLKYYIMQLLTREGAEKVNLIAHSKGGLDTRYMIEYLEMRAHVASVTFLGTPHNGSQVASRLNALPFFIKTPLVHTVNLCYRALGDRAPDAARACLQLCHNPQGVLQNSGGVMQDIFMQSFSGFLEKGRDDLLLALPFLLFRDSACDGLVSEESSRFARYRGHCAPGSVSHLAMVDFMSRQQTKRKVYAFYLSLCRELALRGF